MSFFFSRTVDSTLRALIITAEKALSEMTDVWIDQGTRNDGDRFATTAVCGCACKMPTGASGSR